jgi:hypothetical protein
MDSLSALYLLTEEAGKGNLVWERKVSEENRHMIKSFLRDCHGKSNHFQRRV